MAKFCGVIGYAHNEQTSPGVWEETIVERKYYGDITKNSRRLNGGENLNDNIALTNIVSVMADAYAYENFFAIRYVEWMGANWKVSTVEVQRPRLILTLGGVYNGAKA